MKVFVKWLCLCWTDLQRSWYRIIIII